jgi:hypothetical protein
MHKLLLDQILKKLLTFNTITPPGSRRGERWQGSDFKICVTN